MLVSLISHKLLTREAGLQATGKGASAYFFIVWRRFARASFFRRCRSR